MCSGWALSTVPKTTPVSALWGSLTPRLVDENQSGLTRRHWWFFNHMTTFAPPSVEYSPFHVVLVLPLALQSRRDGQTRALG